MTGIDKTTDPAKSDVYLDSFKDRISIRQAYKELGSKPGSQEHLLSLFMNGDIVTFINLPNGFVGIPKQYWAEQSPQNLGANRVSWRKVEVLAILPLLIPVIVAARKLVLHVDFSRSRHSDAGWSFEDRYPELAIWLRSRSQQRLGDISAETIADELDALLESVASCLKQRFLVRLSRYELGIYLGGENGRIPPKRGPKSAYLEEAFWVKLIEYIGPVGKMVKSEVIVENMIAWCEKNTPRYANFEVQFSKAQIEEKIRLVTKRMGRGVNASHAQTRKK